MLAWVLAAVIEDPQGGQAVPAAPPHVYLHPSVDGCDSRAPSDEVVVCADKNRDTRYRLQSVDNGSYRDKPLAAKMKLGSGSAALGAAPASVGGWPSNRIMVTLKFPF